MARLRPQQSALGREPGHPPIEPGTSLYLRGYSGGVQTAWLERTLAAGRRDESVDWIIAQMHQCAASSSASGNGSDLGLRAQWRPLFDRYQVRNRGLRR